MGKSFEDIKKILNDTLNEIIENEKVTKEKVISKIKNKNLLAFSENQAFDEWIKTWITAEDKGSWQSIYKNSILKEYYGKHFLVRLSIKIIPKGKITANDIVDILSRNGEIQECRAFPETPIADNTLKSCWHIIVPPTRQDRAIMVIRRLGKELSFDIEWGHPQYLPAN